MVPVHPQDRPLLGMLWQGSLFVDSALTGEEVCHSEGSGIAGREAAACRQGRQAGQDLHETHV